MRGDYPKGVWENGSYQAISEIVIIVNTSNVLTANYASTALQVCL
jgi:ABC-2 type transport system permease protein